MYAERLKRTSACAWTIDPCGAMRVPVTVYADKELIEAMDEPVYRQAANVASLPGVVKASYAMPDAHWGYGFPIGGVAGFDPEQGGVISAGGVGFDIACGVRAIRTGLQYEDIERCKDELATKLARHIPAGVGSQGKLKLSPAEMDDMLQGGAHWAIEQGYGTDDDLAHIEENGRMAEAVPKYVSVKAKERQTRQVGTLGSGNHYLEVQRISAIYDAQIAEAFALKLNDIVVSIHCGSRGLGHQVATDFLPQMVKAAKNNGIDLAERELACAPIRSDLGATVLRGDERRDQLRRGQSPGADPSASRGLRRPSAPRRSQAIALRCVAQYVQGRRARGRWQASEALHPSQGRHAGVRSGTSRPAGRFAEDRTTRSDRWDDGHSVLHSGRHGDGHGFVIRVVLSRGGPGDESQAGRQAMARQGRREALVAEGHPHPGHVVARRGRGGPGRLQRRSGRGRRH